MLAKHNDSCTSAEDLPATDRSNPAEDVRSVIEADDVDRAVSEKFLETKTAEDHVLEVVGERIPIHQLLN